MAPNLNTLLSAAGDTAATAQSNHSLPNASISDQLGSPHFTPRLFELSNNDTATLTRLADPVSPPPDGDPLADLLNSFWPDSSNSSQIDSFEVDSSSSLAPTLLSSSDYNVELDSMSFSSSPAPTEWVTSNLTALTNRTIISQFTSPVSELGEPSPLTSTTMAPTSSQNLSSSITTLMNTLMGVNKVPPSHHSTSTSPPLVHLYDYPTSSESEDSPMNITSFFGNRPPGLGSSTTAIFPTDDEDAYIPRGSMCYSSPEDYELFTSMLCSSLLVLGVVYFTFGYRCFRAVAFFTGLFFGTALAYAVCTAEHLIDIPYGNLVVALAAGLMVGLLTMLVIYIGLFVIGLHLGLLLGVALLSVIYLLRPYFEVLQPPLSALTLLIFFVAVGLVGAFSTIYFSKGCTIIGSSLYGSALTLLCADYFVENFNIVHWFLDNLSNGDDWYGLLQATRRGLSLCLGSQIILALWPSLTLLGIIIQGCLTGRGVQYRSGYGSVASAGTASSMVLRSGHTDITSTSRESINSRGKSPEEVRLEQKHRKYRYLYQVRTAHGDVISQHYFQSMQNKKLCLPDQDSFTFNSDLSSHFLPESRTTTLSVA